MSSLKLLLFVLLIISLICLATTCYRRCSGGTAIGDNTYGMSIEDRRILGDYGSKSEEVDTVMTELRNPIKGGENPDLFGRDDGDGDKLRWKQIDVDSRFTPIRGLDISNR